MKPDHYADIKLSGKTIPVIAAKVARLLHTLMAEHPDTYALAFPGMKIGTQAGEQPQIGSMIRLFASSTDAVEQALDRLELEMLTDSTQNTAPPIHTGRVRTVPADYRGPWVTYHRFRIPARRGKSEQHQEKRLRLRAKRIQEARVLPYLILQSASTRQTFSLIIQPQEHSIKTDSTGIPDGYGFSSKESPLYLPKL